VDYYWQPPIDKYIPESYAGNTERQPQSWQYSPAITDYAGVPGFSTEDEELRIDITGLGRLSLNEVKSKIVEMLNDLVTAAKSDNVSDVEKLEYKIYGAPELANIIREYTKHIKLLKTKNS